MCMCVREREIKRLISFAYGSKNISYVAAFISYLSSLLHISYLLLSLLHQSNYLSYRVQKGALSRKKMRSKKRRAYGEWYKMYTCIKLRSYWIPTEILLYTCFLTTHRSEYCQRCHQTSQDLLKEYYVCVTFTL